MVESAIETRTGFGERPRVVPWRRAECRTERLCTTLLAVFFAGCLATDVVAADARKTAGADPMKTVAPPLSFDTDRVKREISAFLESRKSRSGLLPSFSDTATTSFANETGRFHDVYHQKLGYLDDGAYTYDLALAIMGFLLNGQQEDAERILNLLEREFYMEKNGTRGLYNSYKVNDNYTKDDLAMGGDGDRMHAGPILWVAIAALNHAKLTRNTRYLEFTLDIIDWCRKELTYYRFPDGERGGISMGMGWGPDWTRIFSTEHNVDYYSVLQMLETLYAESSPDVQAIFDEKKLDGAWLRDERDHIGRFLREVVFNWDLHIFNAGVNENGVDTMKILDGTSWGLGGIGPENFVSWGIDLDRLVASALKHCSSTYTLENGEEVHGIDFTDVEGYDNQRQPLVWFEGTGQFIVGLAELARYYARRGDEERARKYAAMSASYTEDMNKFSSFYHLDSALPYMAIRPPTNEIVKTLKWEWEIARGKTDDTWVKSMSSTMWYLYSVHDYYNTMKWNLD